MTTCECGCGETTPIAKVTSARRGIRAGEHARFAHGHNRRGRGRDWTGQRFGWLTVIAEAPRRRDLRYMACRCDCGEEATVLSTNLSSGHTRSCGCRKRLLPGHASHGHAPVGAATRTYRTWCSMIARCTNPNASQWRYYGGRGVTVCPEWRESFPAFLADMGERPEGRSIDRIDPHGNYEPGNCRWATPSEQARNRRKK